MLKNVVGLLCLLSFVSVVADQAVSPKEPISGGWLMVEERARNAVVQIVMQGTAFNWLEPYKTPEHRQPRGTGFFIDSQGHLLTNYHVVEGAKSLHILVPALGRKQLDVTVVGVCPDLDIALLKLTPESYKNVITECGFINTLEFGDSDKLRSTQEVLLIGYPLGISSIKNTIGYIGGRDFRYGRSLIHTTAPTNPGNSGGPQLDMEGKVVGVVCSTMTNAQNYNYFIPINDVLLVLNNMYKQKFVRRPDLEIGANRGTAAHARSLNNPLPAGVYINYVQKDSIVGSAGLRAGDMVYEITINADTYKIDEFGEVSVAWRQNQKVSVTELISRCRLGDKIGLLTYRQGKKMQIQFPFEESTLNPVRYIYPEYEAAEIDFEIFGGIVVMQLRENHIQLFKNESRLQVLKKFLEYDRPENQPQHVLTITHVVPGSQGQLTECLTSGFILDKINGQTVTTLQELRKALQLSTQTFEISIETKDRYSTVLDLNKVIQDEDRLAKAFGFSISETMKYIIAQVEKKKKRIA